LKGTRAGLKDPGSILISELVATTLFGDTDPINKIVKLDNKVSVKVAGVYEDLPKNTKLAEVSFVLPWNLYLTLEPWLKDHNDPWNNNMVQVFAQLNPNVDVHKASEKIKNIKLTQNPQHPTQPTFVLHPMSRWHLYSGGKTISSGEGRITYVWLFGVIGFFVLLLACINFMNLSTARTEKRAKEVGIRKTIGSGREQLIKQFLSESLLITILAGILSLLLVQLALPWFNQLADKSMVILWNIPVFWLLMSGFIFLTGLISGSYPALYLSSFEPVKVLKGTFRTGRLAVLPRQVLVVLQFAVSVTLIIGTVVVYRQIQFAKNRPIGYSREGLITVTINTPELQKHFAPLRQDLLKTGAVAEVAQSNTEPTNVYSTNGGFEWTGKDPNFNALFGTIAVTHDYGKTVGWQFKEGRDFSREFSTDSTAFVLNEAAVEYIGFKNPIGQNLKWQGKNHKVIGVIKNMVMQSPFEPVQPAIFFIDYGWARFINIKLNPNWSASESLQKVAEVFKKHNPGSPFDYKFVDEEYGRKFSSEERIGQLASFFAVLAIFISCLGIFGMAAYMAEQRTKEIGVRKVLGASVFTIWRLLSKDFVVLVVISLLIATPIAYYFMHQWLQNYTYRSPLSWWIFAAAGLGALLITLLTVSFQAIKAALMNPINALRNE
ncbi:MAG: ABC transporter permease, partial [Bacteroidota bacterium]|nr:ABC transporter permease [Bacteroidota bacterium]